MAGFIGLLCLLAVTCASPTSRNIQNGARSTRIPAEFLVSVRPNIARGESLKQAMNSFVEKMAAFSDQISVVAQYDFTKLSVLHVKSKVDYLVTQLYSFPEVSSIETNVYEEVTDQQCVEQTGPIYWNLSRLQIRQGTNLSPYSYQEDDGAGGYVYVMDSGIRTTHNEFGGRAIHGFTAPDVNEEEGDFRGHGTHCAGIVIGSIHGVAKAAGAIAVKVLNEAGFGTIAGAVAGLSWITQDFTTRNEAAGGNFPAVVTVSLSYAPSDALDGAVQELFNGGLITTTSAGNGFRTACSQSPARAEAAITVMASNPFEALSWYSNYGPCANIIAPGDSIGSAYIADDDDTAILSGTSEACPHVAGVLLRHMTQMIDATGHKPSPTEQRDWLLENSTKDVIFVRPVETTDAFLYGPCDVTAPLRVK